MLVVLDPAFFQEDGIDGRDPVRRQAAMHRLRLRLDQANVLLTHPGARLVLAVGSLAWFDLIFRDQARSIEGAADRPLKRSFARLREHRKHGRTLPGVPLAGQMWGVVQMAAWPALAPSRRLELEVVLAASVTSAASDGLPVVFLCNRIEGRNVADRSSSGVELSEVLRWRLCVAIQGAPTTLVPCLGHRRHLDVPWTRRIDDRLPDLHGPGRHPYCPPPRWMNSRTTVWATHQSRPCWLDAQGQWWARPATGGGHHWDVYLNPDEEKRIGLDQINVTQHGAPADEGEPGTLHHVPEKKLHALKTRSGWRCPP